MRRIIAVIVLISSCFFVSCDLLTKEQKQDLEKYGSIRVDTNPSGPMLYSIKLSDDWDNNKVTIVDENWNIVFADVTSASYLVDTFMVTETPESVVGMRIETVDEEGNPQTKIVDKTGRQLGGLDGYNISYEVKNGHMIIYYYEDDYSALYTGIYDIANETIVMAPQKNNMLEILNEKLVFIRNDDGVCRFADYSGKTICELPGISYVETYNYDGGDVLAASNRQENYGDCNGLIDLEGNWLTETNYKAVNSRFFGEYTLAMKYALEYGEYGSVAVLLDRSGTEYELDIPPANDWYYYYPMQEFAVVNVPNDGIYIIKSDRSVEKIGDGWGYASILGDLALIETEEGIMIIDRKGNEISFMEEVSISGYLWFADKYITLYDRNTETIDLYKTTENGLEKLDIADVQGLTPDGRFFVCRNSSATGFKDMDGNWVYKDYLFNYLTD